MRVNVDKLSAQTDALRKYYTSLDSVGVDVSKVHERSKVLQLSFIENGSEVPTFDKVYSYRKSLFQRLWRQGTARIESDQTELFWIDCPKGDFTKSATHQKRRALRDCATLDKLARLRCTKEERMRLVVGYLDQPVDAPEVATFAQAISAYRRKRFDAEDECQAQARQHQAKTKANAAQSK
jgi:hypothetical protein